MAAAQLAVTDELARIAVGHRRARRAVRGGRPRARAGRRPGARRHARAAGTTTSTSPPRRGPTTPSGCSPGWGDALWDMGRDVRHHRLPQGRVGGRGDDVPLRRLRPRVPQAGRRLRRHASPATWAGATSPSTRWRCGCRARSSRTRTAAWSTSRSRLLRTPGRPEDSFSDDPLRMMRAARFAAQLGFTVDPAAVAAMTDMAERITIISAERVRDELVKLVCAPYPRLGLALLVETGLAELVLPELPALALERDEHHRHKDVYEHTLTVLEQAIDLEPRLPASGPGLRVAVRGADARRRQAADPAVRRRRHGHLPPPRRRRRQADPQADAGAALLQRRDRGGRPAGRAAPALPRLRVGRVDRLRRTPLRPRRRRPAASGCTC